MRLRLRLRLGLSEVSGRNFQGFDYRLREVYCAFNELQMEIKSNFPTKRERERETVCVCVQVELSHAAETPR